MFSAKVQISKKSWHWSCYDFYYGAFGRKSEEVPLPKGFCEYFWVAVVGSILLMCAIVVVSAVAVVCVVVSALIFAFLTLFLLFFGFFPKRIPLYLFGGVLHKSFPRIIPMGEVLDEGYDRYPPLKVWRFRIYPWHVVLGCILLGGASVAGYFLSGYTDAVFTVLWWALGIGVTVAVIWAFWTLLRQKKETFKFISTWVKAKARRVCPQIEVVE